MFDTSGSPSPEVTSKDIPTSLTNRFTLSVRAALCLFALIASLGIATMSIAQDEFNADGAGDVVDAGDGGARRNDRDRPRRTA